MTIKELQALIYIPLSKAWQCANCDGFTNQSRQCPSCGSNNLTALTNWVKPIKVTEATAETK